MNSSVMATNLLGRPVRLRERPASCATDTGSITMVWMDNRGIHFLVLLGGQLIAVDSAEQFLVLD
jgi:hypothetical protein